MNQDYETNEYLTTLCMHLMDQYGSRLMQTCYADCQTLQQLQPMIMTNGDDQRHQVKFSYYRVPKGDIINADNLVFNVIIRMKIEPIMVQTQSQLNVLMDTYDVDMTHHAAIMKQTVSISNNSDQTVLIDHIMDELDKLVIRCL